MITKVFIINFQIMLIKSIRKEIYKYLNEEIISNLVLYRGIESEDEKPDNDYFFVLH